LRPNLINDFKTTNGQYIDGWGKLRNA